MFQKFYSPFLIAHEKTAIFIDLPIAFCWNTNGVWPKKPLDHSVYDSWKLINNEQITNNGNWAAYVLQPRMGDANLLLHQVSPAVAKGRKTAASPAWQATQKSFARGTNPTFSWDSQYLLFRIRPHLDTLKNQRRRKVKEDKLPKDSLGIYALASGKYEKVAEVKSFAMPEKAGGWAAWLLHPQDAPKPPKPADSTQAAKPAPKIKKENKDNGSKLIVKNLQTNKQDTFRYVLDYRFSETASALAFISTGDDSLFLPGVYVYDLQRAQLRPLYRAKGKYKTLSWDEAGEQLAFMADLDTTKARIRPHQLAYWRFGQDSARIAVGSTDAAFPQGWLVSEHGRLFFSQNGQRLFFGTAPAPILQDTMLLPEEIVNVEVWNYQDQYLYTQQQAEKDRELKRTYLAVWLPNSGRVMQIGTEEIPQVQLPDEGNGNIALGMSNLPYGQFVTWEGYPPYYDLYLIDLPTNTREKVVTKMRGQPSLSPAGQFVTWYQPQDTAWLAMEVATRQIRNLSANAPTQFWSELHDYPDFPAEYGDLGWLENDIAFLVYDRYDVWQLDPRGGQPALRLTQGRETRTAHRYIRLDPEERYLKMGQELLFHAHHEPSRAESYVSWKMGTKMFPQTLLKGDFMLASRPIKALESDKILFTQETFQQFPDVRYSDMSFANSVQLSKANPQQQGYLWGSAEVVKWTSLDGVELEGLLFKPENFDPKKKYPMIVNFYERSSETLHRHRAPEPHRSTINYTFYTSRGYLVFNPDVPYKPGYPGESCYNAVMPGIMSLMAKGFVDEQNIAAQGHSWGGYQVAYLATRTHLFKCIESGAPVANMVSAYGGIRWETGLSRMFQYEHSQSRVGGTLWEEPLRYLENSPIFTLDKVTTPMLIMHNDADGHVPWYQGIELFVALRRLGKPAWMLNYNGEPHWPLKYQNQKDFVLRMQQFFDHYLKGAPAPEWMEKGLPAKYKGIIQGYELMERE